MVVDLQYIPNTPDIHIKHKGGYIAVGAGCSGNKSQWWPFCFSVTYFVSRLLYVYAGPSVLWQVWNSLGRCGAALPTRPRTGPSRAAWQGDSRVATGKGVLFRRPVPLGAAKTHHAWGGYGIRQGVNKFGVYEFQANYQAHKCII